MDHDRLIAILSGHRSFAGIDAQTWQHFLEAAAVVSFNPGEVIYDRKAETSAGYLLVQGRLEIIDEPYPERRLCTQIFSAGSLFCEGGFIKEWPARRRCTAIESSTAIKMSSENFTQIVENANTVALRIIDRLLDNFVQEVELANQRLDEIYGRPDRTLRRLLSTN